MSPLRMQSCLLLGAALLAACSERNTPTAPSSRLLAATTAVDRPYTWSFTCHSGQPGITINASWDWTENGTVISGYGGYVWCTPGNDLSGSGVRPANANGFTADVGDNSNSWTFDPAGPFTATLKGSVHVNLGNWGWLGHSNYKIDGTLTVDS